MGRIKTTKWNLFFLYLRMFIAIANSVLIIPLYLKYIDHDLFGAWMASGNVLTWITLVDPGVGDVLIQKIASSHAPNGNNALKSIITASLIISFFVAIIAFFFGFVFSFYLVDILNLSVTFSLIELLHAFQINILATSITLFFYCLSSTILGFQHTKFVGLVMAITGVLGILLNLVLLLNGYGLYSIAYANLFRSAFACICFAIFFLMLIRKEKLKLGVEKKFFFSYAKIFTYTFVSKLFSTFANNMDLILVSRYVGPQAVIALEVTRRPIRALQGFVTAPSISLLPTFSSLYGEGDYDKVGVIIKRFLRLILWVLLLYVFGFITFNKSLIHLWVGEQFYIGSVNNLLICITLFITTLSYCLSNLTYSMGNIKGNSIIEGAKSIVYILLLLLLGKYFGLRGVLIAALLTTILMDTWYYPRKVMLLAKINKNDVTDFIRSNSTIFFAILILSVIFYFFEINSWSIFILITVLFTIIYIFFLFATQKNFRTEINPFIPKFLKKEK